MIELALMVLVVSGGPHLQRDTLIDVRPGDRLVLEGFEGTVVVRGWDRPVLSLEAEDEEEVSLGVRRSGSRLELRVQDRKNRPRSKELRVLLPPWMAVEITGRKLEAEVRDLEGEVLVRTLRGDLILADLSGPVQASSVEGEISASGLSGFSRLRTGEDDLVVRRSTGVLELETVEGDVAMEGIESPAVTVQTTDGDIDFRGSLPSNAEVRFTSHGGDMTLRLAPPVDVDVSVVAYEGDFRSTFPVRAGGYRSGERVEFTIGRGGARLILESFDGDIDLLEGRESRTEARGLKNWRDS